MDQFLITIQESLEQLMALEVQKNTKFCCQRLVKAFHNMFSLEYDTILVAGGEEPLYVPAGKFSSAKIIFREDYFASALHEVAHWCIAGEGRRAILDYGYWYAPDGRTSEEQVQFESVEIKPQALEWIFSMACGYRFQVSVDNLSANNASPDNFKLQLVEQVRKYCEAMPQRALRFANVLADEFGQQDILNSKKYLLSDLA